MKGAAIGLTSFGARARPPGDQKKNAKNIETMLCFRNRHCRCAVKLTFTTFAVTSRPYCRLWGEGLMWLIGAMVCLLAAP